MQASRSALGLLRWPIAHDVLASLAGALEPLRGHDAVLVFARLARDRARFHPCAARSGPLPASQDSFPPMAVGVRNNCGMLSQRAPTGSREPEKELTDSQRAVMAKVPPASRTTHSTLAPARVVGARPLHFSCSTDFGTHASSEHRSRCKPRALDKIAVGRSPHTKSAETCAVTCDGLRLYSRTSASLPLLNAGGAMPAALQRPVMAER